MRGSMTNVNQALVWLPDACEDSKKSKNDSKLRLIDLRAGTIHDL